MATRTRDQIIESAYKIAGILDPESSLAGWMTVDATHLLDDILAALENEGVRFWKRNDYKVSLTASSTVTNGGKNYECIRNHTSGATTEPGVGGLWTHYWVEITTTGSGTWVTSTSYTTSAQITLPSTIVGISKAQYRDADTQDDFPIKILSLDRAMDITDKVTPTSNAPTAIYQLGTFPIQFLIYPRPTNATDYTLLLTVDEAMTDVGAAGAAIDVQRQWNLAIEYTLADMLCDRHGVPIEKHRAVNARAQRLVAKAKGRDLRKVTCIRARPGI